MAFDDLGLSPKVLAAVEAAGYKEPTPIQAQAIPHVMSRRDIIGIAQTGTGKTASFVLPMLSLLEKGRARARMPRTLILEPTRELAAQVEQNFVIYGQNHKLTVALLIGGVSFDEQEKKLDRGADVLIATPGRLLDHVERGKLLLTGVEILVIDEADRMLDMGFIPDIERICRLVPFTRQTLFFSATMPNEIQRLTGQFLHNPEQIEVARQATAADTVRQVLVTSPSVPKEKRAILRQEIRDAKNLTTAIVFCNRKRDVATLHRSLQRHGFNAGALHGDLDQRERMATLAKFRAGEINLLIASDVAARGLDIPAVSHVFNFDVPSHAEDYVHRIGRTGRAGREGDAITIATPDDRKYVASIEKMLGGPIPRRDGSADEATGGDDAPEDRKQRSRRGGGKDSRQGGRSASSSKSEKPQDKQTEERASGRQSDRSERKPGKSRRSSEDAGADRPVIGLGDHVPDFLLRPVRRPADTSGND
ncbi:DEAD/DEAH box helicase [Microbaculum marinum]|uniref:DEAD-box ATP-dependent RNA helicase RhpA n=1 Tax=Microbaculum marinum TaxID=1764581 RepID=A0AAW9RZ23_9HYPH